MDFKKIICNDNSIVLKNVENFNIKQIAECGQCFRWKKIKELDYVGVAYERVIEVIQKDDTVTILNSTKDDFYNIWLEYFDLHRDYTSIKKELSKDPILKESVKYGYGIRILNQEPFEMLISFIISARNSIPVISRTIERISKKYGKKITYNGETYYAFPTIQEISGATEDEIRETGASFRSKYIVDTINNLLNNIASGIAYVYTGGQSTRITNKLFIEIGTGYLFNVIPLPVVYMVVLIILFSFILSKTKFGTYVYAIGGNREAARLSGVPIKKIEIIVFTISGLLSAFAGLVLCSRMYSGQPSVGSGYELDAIAACVLGGTSMTGGKGRISGTVFGAMVIGIISNGLNLIGVSSYWQLIIKGLIIACAVLLDGQKGKLELLKKKKLAAN